MIYIGKVAGGAFLGGDASPTISFICFAFGWDRVETIRYVASAVPYMCYSTASMKYILDEKSGKRRTFSLYPVPENCCLSATPALISTLPFAV